MKFDCGDGGREKWDNERLWHKKFCWWPTRLADHDCRWLEFIERLNTDESFIVWSAYPFNRYYEYRASDE